MKQWSQLIALVASLIGLSQGVAFAQFQFSNQQVRITPEEYHMQMLPRNYQLMFQLSEISRAIARKDVDVAISLMQAIVEARTDFFLTDGTQPGRPLSQMLDTIFVELSDEAQAVYERAYGAKAQAALTDAVRVHSEPGVQEVATRYGWTLAGREAISLLAQLHADAGDHGGAARYLDRQLALSPKPDADLIVRTGIAWRLANSPATAAERLSRLDPESQYIVKLRGRELVEGELRQGGLTALEAVLALADDRNASPAELLHDEWRLPRGNAQRVGATELVAPGSPVTWSYPVVDVYDRTGGEAIELAPEIVTQVMAGVIETEKHVHSPRRGLKALIPARSPLIVNDLVVFPGLGTVKAIDMRSGQLKWSGLSIDETFAYLFRQPSATPDPTEPSRKQHQGVWLNQVLWRNQTVANLVSDGRSVFSISDTGMIGAARSMPPFMGGPMLARNHPLYAQQHNRLVAYDLSTGKIQWEAGGAGNSRLGEQNLAIDPDLALPVPVADERPAGSRVSGVFFLGPPLPVDGLLYVLAEDRGQFKLLVLDPQQEGRLTWSIPLLNPRDSVLTAPRRRVAGLTPAFKDGVVICPSADGVITAVDVQRRRLLWTKLYGKPPVLMNQQMAMMMRVQRQDLSDPDAILREAERPESSPYIVGDRIVIAPIDVEELHCLDLHSGERMWMKPWAQSTGMYVASVDAERIVLMSAKSVQALRVSDGEAAWKAPTQIPRPVGRGVRLADQYLFPTETGELIILDIKTGRIQCRSRLPEGVLSGNLVAAGGRLVIQTPSQVIALGTLDDQLLELTGQLAQTPNDPVALARMGELRLQAGDSAAGQELLRQSLAARADVAVQRLLVWSLLSDLEADFEKYRGQADELADKVTDDDQRLLLHSAMAEGLIGAGEIVPAVDHMLSIPTRSDIEETADGGLVRHDRLIRARLADLQREMPEAKRAEIDTLIAAKLERADKLSTAELTGMIELLKPRNSPAMQAAELLLVSRSTAPEVRLNVEHRLWNLWRTGTESTRQVASERLLQLLTDQSDSETVLDVIGALDPGFAKGDPGTGSDAFITALQKVSATPASEARLIEGRIWQSQPVEIDEAAATTLDDPTATLPILGSADGPLAGWVFAIENTGATVAAYDSQGRKRWSHNTGTAGDIHAGLYASVLGRLVLVVLHDRFLVIDAFAGDSDRPVIFNRTYNLEDEQPRFRQRNPIRSKAGLRASGVILNGTNVGIPGPLTAGQICFRQGEMLIAVDPLTGSELWKRAGFSSDAEILGDDEFTVTMSAGDEELRILRAADGQEIARRPLPKDVVTSHRWGDWGRHLLLLHPAPDAPLVPIVPEDPLDSQVDAPPAAPTAPQTLALYDPVENREVWSKVIAGDASWTTCEGDKIGILDPTGSFQLLDGWTGQTVLQAALDPVPNLLSFSVQSRQDRYIVLPRTSEQTTSPRVLPNPTLSVTNPVVFVRGPVTSINRTTGAIEWKTQVEDMSLSYWTPARWPILPFEGRRSGGAPAKVRFIDCRDGSLLRAATLDETKLNKAPQAFGRTSPRLSWTFTSPAQLLIKVGLHSFSMRPQDKK